MPFIYLTPTEAEKALRALAIAGAHLEIELKPFKGTNRDHMTTEAQAYLSERIQAAGATAMLYRIIADSIKLDSQLTQERKRDV